jgi:hypothetical protein
MRPRGEGCLSGVRDVAWGGQQVERGRPVSFVPGVWGLM